MACFEVKSVVGNKSLTFISKEINPLKRQLKTEKTTRIKKSTKPHGTTIAK
jgi:hypothetical protein